MADFYFSGQGIVYVADRDSSGNVTVFRDVGNVPSLKLTLNVDLLDHKESRTGQRLTDLRLVRDRKATVDITLENWSKKNLMMMMYGTTATVTGTSVTNESFGTGVAVGDVRMLQHNLVSGLTIVDSAGSPATLALTTDYTVDLPSGMVTFKNLGAYTQPFKANYSFSTQDVVPFFRAATVERYLRFSGLNTANSNVPTIIDLYRVVFDPAGNIELINDAIAQFSLTGEVLYDNTRDADSTLGGFGRVIQTSPF